MTTEEATSLFTKYFSFSRCREYGIAVTAIADDGKIIDLCLTFLSGRSYCCAEPGCHLMMSGLRSVAAKDNIALPEDLRIRLHGVVEAGAILGGSRRAGFEYRVKYLPGREIPE